MRCSAWSGTAGIAVVLAVIGCGDSGQPTTDCQQDADCATLLEPPNDCQRAACVAGECRLVAMETGEVCEPSRLPGPCEAAACDGEGACRISGLADGSPCDDGDGCTLDDTCQAGVCVAGDALQCPAPGACHLPGTCDPATGQCDDPLAEDGAPCDDGDPDSFDDACRAGACVGRVGVDCPVPPACDLAPPDPGPEGDWRHTSSALIAAVGTPYHRGRDLILAEGSEQWALGKFAYGLGIDKDIHDEDVDIYLLRDCQQWEFLGTATTTDDGEHATVHGVEDTGGRVYFQIPADKRLGVGRHRIHFVVQGDLSTANQYIQVVPDGARVAVSDIDGTLTTGEYAQVWDTLLDISPEAHPGAPEALWALARKGFLIFYLTARPEFLGERTQQWLTERGFPPGISHTTLTHTGASGDDAITYKQAELAALTAQIGRPPDFGFGNKDSDAEAYQRSGLDPAGCYYYELDGDPLGGTIHSDYQALVPIFEALPSLCSE